MLTFTVRCDRISRHGRPGKSSEIPFEMPSKDPTSESFRVPLSLPWMSRIQGAIRAVRRKNRTLFPGHRAPNLRLLSTSRVNLATFRAHRRRHFAKTSPPSGISAHFSGREIPSPLTVVKPAFCRPDGAETPRFLAGRCGNWIGIPLRLPPKDTTSET